MSETPPPPAIPEAKPPGNPKEMVKLPSIFLMVVGGLYLLWIVYLILSTLLGFAIGGRQNMGGMAFSGIGLVINIIISLALSGTVIYGAMQMKNLKNYNMAMAAAIVAMLPCSYCCCLGLGAGIWSLVVLMKPEVKAAFNQSAGTGGFPTT
ncbi:MAG TPA: hypothetical protein VGN88_09295 [Phycisphaerae bacterium]|jgi:hypothetical protein